MCYSVLVDALIHELDVYHMISYVSRVFENCYHVWVNKFNNCAIKCACWYISTQCVIVLRRCIDNEFDVYHMIFYVSRVFKNCYHVSVNKFNICPIECGCWYISTRCVIVFRRCIDTWIWCVSYDFLCITSFWKLLSCISQ